MVSERTKWIGLLFISLSVAMIIVDSTIVNVAIPSIIDDLGITSTQVQWVQESYTLVFAALLLVLGALADRHGRKKLLMVGVVVFALASVFAAIAPTGDLLILARVLQGFGGAMVMPTTLSIINTGFSGRERGIAFAIWGATIGGTVALGPLLGGWLTEFFSWRWAFGINIPLSIIIIIGLLFTVTDAAQQRSTRRIDVVGALLSVVVSASLVFALIEGRNYGWWGVRAEYPFTLGAWQWPFSVSVVPIMIAVSVIAAVVFIVRAKRREREGKSSLLALSLFTIPSFRNGNLAALIVSLGEFGIILALPLWLQNVAGYGALETGAILVALAAGSFLASGLSSAMLKKMSTISIVRVGIFLELAGVLSIALLLQTDSTWVVVAPCLFVYGIGIGFATAQLTGVVLQEVPTEFSGQGSGTQSTARQIGSALGIAVLGTVLFSASGTVFAQTLERDFSHLPVESQTQLVTAVERSAGAAIPGIREQQPDVGQAAADAFTDGTKWAAYTAAGFLLVGLGATFRLHPRVQQAERPHVPSSAEPEHA